MLQRVAVSLIMLAAIILGLQLLPGAADGMEKPPGANPAASSAN